MVQELGLTGKRHAFGGAVLGLLLLVVLVGCTSDDSGKEAKGHDDGHPELVQVTLGVVEASRLGFSQNRMEVPVSHRVQLTLDNNGGLEHDLKVAGIPADVEKAEGGGGMDMGGHGEAEVAVHTQPGTRASVIFTPTHPGTYEVLCTLPGHKEAGMVGQLVVTA